MAKFYMFPGILLFATRFMTVTEHGNFIAKHLTLRLMCTF